MHDCSALLADLGKAFGASVEPGTRRRSSLLDNKAGPDVSRRSRLSLASPALRGSIFGAEAASRAASMKQSNSRAPSLLSSPQYGPESSLRHSSAGIPEIGSMAGAAKDRWRKVSAATSLRAPLASRTPATQVKYWVRESASTVFTPFKQPSRDGNFSEVLCGGTLIDQQDSLVSSMLTFFRLCISAGADTCKPSLYSANQPAQLGQRVKRN